MAEFRVVHPADPGAQWALKQYFAEIGAAFGFEPGTAFDDAVTAFVPPRGVFLLTGTEDAPLACGAVHHHLVRIEHRAGQRLLARGVLEEVRVARGAGRRPCGARSARP